MATNDSAYEPYSRSSGQPAQRGTGVWYDQHKSATFRDANGVPIFEDGRPWWGVIELRSRMPVGPVMPLGWSAPIDVPQNYIIKSIGKVVKNSKVAMADALAKNLVTDRIFIDYQQMRQDDYAATLEHWRGAVQFASAKGWDVPQFGQAMDPRLLEMVGPAPRSYRIAEAFMAGNPWALGMLAPVYDSATRQFKVEDDPSLRAVLTMNRPDLLTPEQFAAQYGTGQTAPVGDEASELRKLLAEAQTAIKALTAAKAEHAKMTPAERMAKARAAKDAKKMAEAGAP